jgi:hypothetical protein
MVNTKTTFPIRSFDSLCLFSYLIAVVGSELGREKKPESYTDKKENQIFLILVYKEIQNGSVAKSYMTNGLLIYGEIFAHFLIY